MTDRRRPRWSELQTLLRPRRLPLGPTERRLATAASIPDLRGLAMRRVPATGGALTLGGQAAALNRGRIVSVGAASFAATGVSAGFARTRVLVAAAGALVFSGRPIGIAAAVYAWIVLPKDDVEPSETFDWVGMILLSPGLAAFLYGISSIPEEGTEKREFPCRTPLSQTQHSARLAAKVPRKPLRG